ncbi:MAG: transglutaminase domain-containing protein [Gammaproteobacteria bacterium]|nr:transglutaminase domain-containing protein [Gammaproteobacteria bacterium]
MSPTSAHTPATALSDAPEDYLAPTRYLDYEHPAVRAFSAAHDGSRGTALERAVRLYYAVRDAIRYDPYRIRTRPDTYRASYVVEQGRGYCGQKAALYAAVCRGAGIPARPGYADVRNHLATERLLRLMDVEDFIYHGYTEVWLEGRWVKATPVFNISLCEKFHVLPLDFDGRTDSLFQPFDARGRRHMEYVRDRGVRADVPVEEITAAMLAAYPSYFAELEHDAGADFEAEAAAQGETSGGHRGREA